MADNIKVAPSATGKDIAADDISDVLHQRVKVQFGVDGSATDVSATNPMPVTIDASDVVSVDDNGGSLTVDGTVAISSSALPSGAATEATLASIDGKITAVNTGAVTVAASALPSGAATESTLSSINTKTPTLASGRVPVDPSGVTSPVSAASLPLPTGAATATNQTTANTVLGATTDAAVTTDANGTLSAKLRGLVKWAYERMPASLGQKTMANSLPVVVASDQSSLGITTGATDAAAAAGQIFPTAVRRVNTVVDLADGALGYVRGTPRQALLTAADRRRSVLTPSAPAPSNSDITNIAGGEITAADFIIRDTDEHTFVIPMAEVGWRHFAFASRLAHTFDQAITCTIYTIITPSTGALTTGGAIPVAKFAISLTNGHRFGIGTAAGGAGTIVGADPQVNDAYYSIPALANALYVIVSFKAAVTPTTGEIQRLHIARST